jgi:hypothetical protein
MNTILVLMCLNLAGPDHGLICIQNKEVICVQNIAFTFGPDLYPRCKTDLPKCTNKELKFRILEENEKSSKCWYDPEEKDKE